MRNDDLSSSARAASRNFSYNSAASDPAVMEVGDGFAELQAQGPAKIESATSAAWAAALYR